MLIRNKKDWNRYIEKEMNKLKPDYLKEIEKAFKDGTARQWNRETLYGVRSYLDRLQISFQTDMKKGMMKAARFQIKPFKGTGKLFSARKNFFSETMAKAAEMISGKSILTNPKAAVSAAASSLISKATTTAPTKRTKGPLQGKDNRRQQSPPPSIKVLLLLKLVDFCIWLFKQAGKFLDEIAHVNKEVMQVQAGQVRVRSKF